MKRKSTAVFRAFVVIAVFVQMLLVGCSAAPSVEGTWYCTDFETEREMWLQFDKDKTGRSNEGIGFTWKQEGDVVTINTAMFSEQVTCDGNTLIDNNDHTYYRTQEEAANAYEEARAAHLAEIDNEIQSAVDRLEEELVGKWILTTDPLIYNPNNEPVPQNTYTVTYKADGTFEWNRVWYEYKGIYSSDAELNEMSDTKTGTWEIQYRGREDKYSPSRFVIYYQGDGEEYPPADEDVWLVNTGGGFEYDEKFPGVGIVEKDDSPVVKTNYQKQ